MESEAPEEIPEEVPEEVPLTTLYLQIEYGDIPAAVLGIGTRASEVEIRDAYRALALRIHPDKAPSEGLRELHTLLFQKVQTAYNSLLEAQENEAGQDRPKQLPETLASLHARNVAFRENLRSAREKALQAKHAADLLKASKEANKKAKDERLAGKRELRAHMLKEEQAKRQTEIAKEKRKFGPSGNLAEDGGAKASSKDLSDWEEMEDDLEAKAASQADESQKPQGLHSNSQLKRPLQNKPTARTATPTWNPALDERLVSDAEIDGCWNANLLSGGRSGSVSLSQKKQREKNAAARMHKQTLALCEEADRMIKPALTGNRTFSGLVEDDLMESAFVKMEHRAQARTERFLQVTDGDVAEQYLLEGQGLPEQSVSLASLFIEDK
jgi:curved DNA-binding protein CbpA